MCLPLYVFTIELKNKSAEFKQDSNWSTFTRYKYINCLQVCSFVRMYIRKTEIKWKHTHKSVPEFRRMMCGWMCVCVCVCVCMRVRGVCVCVWVRVCVPSASPRTKFNFNTSCVVYRAFGTICIDRVMTIHVTYLLDIFMVCKHAKFLIDLCWKTNHVCIYVYI